MLAIAASDLADLIRSRRDHRAVGPGGRGAVENPAELVVLAEPLRGGVQIVTAEQTHDVFHRHAGRRLERGLGLAGERALLALELGAEFEQRLGAVRRILRLEDLDDQLREGDRRIHRDGLHRRDVLEPLVQVDGVEDAESLLADVFGQARRTAEHLLVEDSATHATQEHEVADARDVDPGRQQIDGDGEARQPLVPEAENGLTDVIGRAGDLGDGVVVDVLPPRLQHLLEEAHRHVGVGVGHAEEERLFGKARVDVSRDLLEHDPREALGDDAPIEVLDLEVDVVGENLRDRQLELGVEDEHLVVRPVVNAVLGQLRDDPDGRVVVHQKPVGNRLPVRVRVDRRAEDLGRVEGGRGREADLHRIEVVEDAAVRRDEVRLVAEQLLPVGEITIEKITAVALVDDDAVVFVHRGDGRQSLRVVVGTEDAAHHRLDGGDLQARVIVRLEVADRLHIEDLGERPELLQHQRLEGAERLGGERVAVHHEENATESAGLEEAVAETDARAGLAGAGRHCEERLPAARANRSFDREDRPALVVAVDVRHRLDLELIVGLVDVLLEQVDEAARRVPGLERARMVGRPPCIEEPHAASVDELPQKGPAVGREQKRDPVAAPGPTLRRRFVAHRREPGAVALGLGNDAAHVLVLPLRLDDGDRTEPHE